MSVLTAAAAGTFLETFDGAPTTPLTYSNPHSWDINPSGLDTRYTGAAVQVGQHGPNCERPGFPYTTTNTHPLTSTRDMVYMCNNHIMTTNGLQGYGAVYMIPPAMADFSAGTAKITFDMSTLRTASRDWVYFTLMPFEGHNKYAYNSNDQAIPPHNINIALAGTNAFTATQRAGGGTDVHIGGDGFTTWDMVQAANGGLLPDAARRDSFEIDLSATHLRVCLTGNNAGATYVYRGGTFCWIDSDLPSALSPSVWGGQAVFMMTHVSYNPEKSCSSEEDQFNIVHNATGDAQCPPNTWHWDNVRIDPAAAFTILNPVQQFASFSDSGGANTVNFATPAPAGARLSYIAVGDCSAQQFSVDGGAHWINALPQPATTQCAHPENGGEYWTPIPAGTTSVKFTGTPAFSKWSVSAIAIWASEGGSLPPVVVQPTPAPQPPGPAPQPPGPAPQPPGQPPAAVSVFHSSWVYQSAYPAIQPGTSTPVTLHFRNTGTDSWIVGVPGRQVNLGIAGDSLMFGDLGIADGWLSPNRPATTSESVVPPGSIGTFRFSVRAPQAPGVYRLPLRLVADGVTWLDDQGVFMSVISDAGYHSAWASQSQWPTLRPGETSAPITVVFRNTGIRPWILGAQGQQANLGVVNDDTGPTLLRTGWLSDNRVASQGESIVPSGGLASFTFRVRAPDAPGTYRLPLRPVIDGLVWLEDEGVYLDVTVLP